MSTTLQDIRSATQSTHQVNHKSKRSASIHRLKFAMHRLAGTMKLSGDVQNDITHSSTFPELYHVALLQMGLEDRDFVTLLIHAWTEQSSEDTTDWEGIYEARAY